MKLKTEIIEQVQNVPSRRRVGEKLGMSDTVLYRHLSDNKENGRLTKMDALTAIATEIGIEDVRDLVIEDAVAV